MTSATRPFDRWFILALLSLLTISLAVLFSASGQYWPLLLKQGTRIGLGLVLLFFLSRVHPHWYYKISPYLYWVGIVLLLGVFLFPAHKGAQRWIDVFIFQFQPSELMKIAVPLMLSRYLHDKTLPPNWSILTMAAVILALPCFLILKQPDLGTSLLVMSSGLFVIFLAGLPWRYIRYALGLGLLILPMAWLFVLHDYQKQRVLTFLSPENDPLGAGYHIIQSMIAIGSGGFWGQGWLSGTQSQLHFLPERHTDFIFSVFSEEFGFLGVLILCLSYGLLLYRGLVISAKAPDTFSRLLSGSITGTLFVYMFVNIGMVTGCLPVVGIPLPFISYGGTAMVTLLASCGILIAIQRHQRLY